MKLPCQMTKAEWEAAREDCRPDNLQTPLTKKSSSEAVSKFERLQYLGYGVHDADSQKIREAFTGKIVLSPSEADEILERLQTPITYEDVIAKARSEQRAIEEARQ